MVAPAPGLMEVTTGWPVRCQGLCVHIGAEGFFSPDIRATAVVVVVSFAGRGAGRGGERAAEHRARRSRLCAACVLRYKYDMWLRRQVDSFGSIR